MNANDVREIVKAAKIHNVHLWSIEISARDFKELKSDLVDRFPYGEQLKEPGDIKPNQVYISGITVTGRLCECGAHPEDWQ